MDVCVSSSTWYTDNLEDGFRLKKGKSCSLKKADGTQDSVHARLHVFSPYLSPVWPVASLGQKSIPGIPSSLQLLSDPVFLLRNLQGPVHVSAARNNWYYCCLLGRSSFIPVSWCYAHHENEEQLIGEYFWPKPHQALLYTSLSLNPLSFPLSYSRWGEMFPDH